MAGTSTNPRARFLGAELRDARVRADKGVRELAKELGIGHGYLSQVERGLKVASVVDVASILAKLDVTGDERDRLLHMATLAEQSSWVAVGVPGISEQQSAFMEFENTATEIFEWSDYLPPGLLQTGDFARSILGRYPLADTRVAMRLGRADVLKRRDPVQFNAVIGEKMLRYPMHDRLVMLDQLRNIQDLIKRPNVTVRIMQDDPEFHPGMMGPFVIMRFAKLKPIVYLEHYRASNIVDSEDDVADFIEAARIVSDMAMSPAESAKLIGDVIDGWR